MGRSGKRLHEVGLPEDSGALACVDVMTRAEWDALNQFHTMLVPDPIRADLADLVPQEAKRLFLKQSQGGPSHTEANALIVPGATDGAVDISMLDPTQGSFAQHLCDWHAAYKKHANAYEKNLPCPSRQQADNSVMLLGTAGTGKTTHLAVDEQVP